MCGIAGVITNNKANLSINKLKIRNQIFQGLLIAMEERGNESAGVAFVKENGLSIVKAPCSATDFIPMRRFRKNLNQNYPIMLGHTRYATLGEISKQNAHPFLRGNIVGTHNGQVFNHKDFKKNINVDSEIIFELLNKYNNNYNKAFKKLEGNFAIAWSNISTKGYTLNLVRDGNPLYYTYVKQLQSIFYASTEEALKNIILTFYTKVNILELNESEVLIIDQDLKCTYKQTQFGYNYTKFPIYSYSDKSYKNLDTVLCDGCQTELDRNQAFMDIDLDYILCEECHSQYITDINSYYKSNKDKLEEYED